MEQALINNLEQFILELGRGFAFVERQQHITTENDDFYIDLVFYNFRMKRFVIFELKTHKLEHGDIGQLDMYVRMYDDLVKGPDDNPTIGVLLCTDTDSTIAKYSVLNESQQLFATKYMTYMPTEEELSREIERQKMFFLEGYSAKKISYTPKKNTSVIDFFGITKSHFPPAKIFYKKCGHGRILCGGIFLPLRHLF